MIPVYCANIEGSVSAIETLESHFYNWLGAMFFISIYSAVLLIVFTGCDLSDTVKDLKMEPGVMDISINIEKNEVNVDVILKDNSRQRGVK